MTSVLDELVLVQIADLHFGRCIQSSWNWRQSIPAVEHAYREHHTELCIGLQNAIRFLPRSIGVPRDLPLHLLVSGDLTRGAEADEFFTAHTYLRGEFRTGASYGDRIGLGIPDERLWVVPGNHDHWDAWPWPARGYNPGIYENDFAETPWCQRIQGKNRELTIDLLGLDTNAGFEGGLIPGGRSWFAEGRIRSDHFEILEESLAGEVAPALMRVLLIHHSLDSRPVHPEAQPLVASDRDGLVRFSAGHACPMVLTGHTHEFCTLEYSAGSGPRVLEYRSSTTVQGPPDPRVQGFLVHWIRYVEVDDRKLVEWRPWNLVWTEADDEGIGGQFSAGRDGLPVETLWWDPELGTWDAHHGTRVS